MGVGAGNGPLKAVGTMGEFQQGTLLWTSFQWGFMSSHFARGSLMKFMAKSVGASMSRH